MFKLDKKEKSAVIVFAIIAVLYALIFTIIPFPKNAASWISFGFTLVSFVVGLGICLYAFKNDSLASKVYGVPVLKIGVYYIVAQFIIGVIICLVAAFVAVPYWVSLLLGAVILAAAIIGVIATGSEKDYIEETDEEIERITKAVKTFGLDIASAIDICPEGEAKTALVKLAEDIRYSDPVSSEATEEIEGEIIAIIENIKTLISENSPELLPEIVKAKNMLAERNRICKANKK